jgi:glyoxylase-like metal-dependent hydrolase (beta-lactamase superfamily II)
MADRNIDFGVPVQVLPGIHSVAVPLPNNPLKAINAYFIMNGDRILVVDVGFDHPQCFAALSLALRELGRSWADVDVLLTHSHPDHVGGMGRVFAEGMQVYAFFESFEEVLQDSLEQQRFFSPILTHAGLLAPVERNGSYGNREDGLQPELMPRRRHIPVRKLASGERISAGSYSFTVLHTPGHDRWHVCLVEEKHGFVVVGDHVLGSVTPVIGTWQLDGDPLKSYYDSLSLVEELGMMRGLPAHGRLIEDMPKRISELRSHHDKRLEETLALLKPPAVDVIEASRRMSWKHTDWDAWPFSQKFFAVGETLAHLLRLEAMGLASHEVIDGKQLIFLPN